MSPSMNSSNSEQLFFDVIIVGAGISGLNAAYRVQNQAPSKLSYCILEGRENLGGTWDLFKYPGIRSDSDIFTFGFPWSPWTEGTALGSGEQIKKYLNASVQSAGIDQNICYRHFVESADWSSKDKQWVLSVRVPGEEKPLEFRSRFVMLGTGYYDYDTPLQTDIPGISNFEGKVIHPQFWPTDFDYTDKEIVIIGSGATAVTILPSVSDRAKRTTMLQRSPGYIFSLPTTSLLGYLLFLIFPASIAHFFSRMFWLFKSHATTWFCRGAPGLAKWYIKQMTLKQLPPNIKWDPNFKPKYNPWEQRFCASMDGDFYAALRSGKADIITDTIKTVTKNTIELNSGNTLHPDVIVTATGLKLKFAGGIKFSVDGTQFNFADKFAWKSAMLADVPNLVFMTGYETASWTLGADVSAQLFVRLLKKMEKTGAKTATPRLRAGDEKMPEKSMLALSSTYLKNARLVLPKGGIGQWAPKTNYFEDIWGVQWGDISTGIKLE